MTPYDSRLNREIIRHILADVGAVPGPSYGKFGIVNSNFLSKETLDFVFDEGITVRSPVYFAELLVDNTSIKAMFVDLSVSSTQEEYMLIFQNGNNPIYGIRLAIFDEEDNGLFMIHSVDHWVDVSVTAKCRALVGFEMIVSHGLSWNYCQESAELRKAAESLATQV